MAATGAPGGVARLERARALGQDLHEALPDVPTGVATLTNRMMPLLFPDRRRARRDRRDRPLAAADAASACAPSRPPAPARSVRSPSQRTAATTTRVRGSALWSSSATSTAISSASRERCVCCVEPDRAVPRPRCRSGRTDLRRLGPPERVRLGQHGVGGRAAPSSLARVRGGRERTTGLRDPHVSRPGPGRGRADWSSRSELSLRGLRSQHCPRRCARVPCPPCRASRTRVEAGSGDRPVGEPIDVDRRLRSGRLEDRQRAVRPGEDARPAHDGDRDGPVACRPQRPVGRDRAARQLRHRLQVCAPRTRQRQRAASEPTAAPFGFPNCRRTLRSRLVNSWRSPALSFRGGTSTLDSDVVVETSGSPTEAQQTRDEATQDGSDDGDGRRSRQRATRATELDRSGHVRTLAGRTLDRDRLPHVTRQPPCGVERVCTLRH